MVILSGSRWCLIVLLIYMSLIIHCAECHLMCFLKKSCGFNPPWGVLPQAVALVPVVPPRPLCGLGRLGEAHMWEPPGGPHAPTHHLTPQLSSETASRCTHTGGGGGDGLREEPGCTSWAEGIFMQLLSGLSTLRWMVLFYWLLLLLSILCLKVWE